ncbi:MAG: hypothetical protein JWQ54_5428 [Mucilaginibacter sp.]|nr:hypothetical protein [Mucilaginibacter sp.]
MNNIFFNINNISNIVSYFKLKEINRDNFHYVFESSL